MTVDDLVELEVGAPAAGGACVARHPDGRVVFVRHAMPGERVRARITGETTSYLRADAVEVLDASPDRVEPPCPYARPGRCGGCDWQHVPVPVQRSWKAQLVAEQLRRVAKVERDVVVEELPESPDGLRWRTRVQFAVQPDGRAGLHRHRSSELELVDRCLIATDEVEAAGVERREWPGVEHVEVLGVDGQTALSVRARRGSKIRQELPHGVRTTVRGRSFEVAAGGFWQVHRAAPEVLAGAVLDALQPQLGERVVDLYAGVGLFAALLGDAVGPEGSVVAVEADQRACADAARNTADQPHVRIRTAPVDAALVRRTGDVDLVVLDPPRTGAGLEVTRELARLRPRAMAYVSCDAASFARDLRVLLDAGWTLEGLRAFDLFPMTEHVELVAHLTPPA